MKTYTIKTDRKDNYRNAAGAYFERLQDSAETYAHFCDGIQRKYMTPVFVHDVNGYIRTDAGNIHANFCPLCGARLAM